MTGSRPNDLDEDPVPRAVVEDVDQVAQHQQLVGVLGRRRQVLHAVVQVGDRLHAHEREV